MPSGTRKLPGRATPGPVTVTLICSASPLPAAMLASGAVPAPVAAAIPQPEAARARALHELQLLDTPATDRASRHAWFLERLSRLGDDCPQLDAAAVRTLYQGETQ